MVPQPGWLTYLAERTLLLALGGIAGVAAGSIWVSVAAVVSIVAATLTIRSVGQRDPAFWSRIRWSALLFSAGMLAGSFRMTAAINGPDLDDVLPSRGMQRPGEWVELELTARTGFPFEYQGFGEYSIPIDVLRLVPLPPSHSHSLAPIGENGPAQYRQSHFKRGLRIMLRLQKPDSNRPLLEALRTRYGITLHGTVRYRNQRTPGNPGAFDFGSVHASRNCNGLVSAKAERLAIVQIGSWWHPAAVASRLRAKLRIALYQYMPKSFAAIGSGIGLGDSAGLRNQTLWGENIKETFRPARAGHPARRDWRRGTRWPPFAHRRAAGMAGHGGHRCLLRAGLSGSPAAALSDDAMPRCGNARGILRGGRDLGLGA